MCETCNLPTAPLRAPNRQPPICPQSQRSARDGGKLSVDGNRQNATGCSRAQRKLVPARARPHAFHASWLQSQQSRARPRPHARGNGVPFPFSRHGLRLARSRLDSLSIPPGLVIPALTHVIPAGSRHSRTHPRHSREGGNLPLRDSTRRSELPSHSSHQTESAVLFD